MSTEQKYRELTPGEVIQPGDEWMDFQGNWHRGMTNSMGENYRPEPDGRGMTYHCRHRRPVDLQSERPTPESDYFYRAGRTIAISTDGILEFAKEAKAFAQNLERERDEARDWQSIKVTKNGETHPLGRLVEMLEMSYKEASIERDDAVNKVAHLKDVLADANKNYRLLESENLSLNGQENQHKEEVAKLNANYLQVMVERDNLRAMTTPPEPWMPKPPQNLREDIIRAINCRSAENGSNTPDWILGDFLMQSLKAFDDAVCCRNAYYRIPDDVPETDPPATTVG